MSIDEIQIHLTKSEILALVDLIDKEREWTKMLVKEQHSAALENLERRALVEKLDSLTKRLMSQID